MLLDLGFLIVFTLGATGLGLVLLRPFRVGPAAISDRLALALPLGLGTQGLTVFGLGQVGGLTPGALAAVVGLSCLGWLFRGRRETPEKPSSEPNPSRTFDRVWDVLLGAVVLGTLASALLPVTDGDALCYHLQVPKMFLQWRGLGYDPDLHETVYPLLTESLYTIALALRGPVACRLIQWLLGLVLALNVAAMARPWLGARARWASTIALLSPAISNGMSAPLNDVALAAFANAALFAWLRWKDAPSTRSAALAGILSGFALGVKFPALVLFGILGVAMVAMFLRQRFSREIGRGILVFGLTTLVVGSPWYWRAYQATGNPVHPFFRQAFGGAGLDEVLDPIKRPMAVNPLNVLTALAPMTLQPERFDSFSHQFGPLFLLFLPALTLEKPPRRLALIVFVGFTFLTLCVTQRQSMRFVLMALGPFSVGVAWLAARWWSRPGPCARGLVGLVLLGLAFEASIALARPRRGVDYLLGRESAETYLSRREPTYRVGGWIASNLPADARIIGQDHRGYYLPRLYTMELAHRRRTGLGSNGESANDVVKRLKIEGFTHVLLCPPIPEDAVEFDPTLGRLLDPWVSSRTPVYREDLADADGVVRRYAIYDLSADAVASRRGEGKRR